VGLRGILWDVCSVEIVFI